MDNEAIVRVEDEYLPRVFGPFEDWNAAFKWANTNMTPAMKWRVEDLFRPTPQIMSV